MSEGNYFQDFANGLKESFKDILTLEVNTMVVTEITGFKFNPINAYEDIYNIPKDKNDFQEKLHNDDFRQEYPAIVKSFENVDDQKLKDSQMERLIKLRNRLKQTCLLVKEKVLTDDGELPPSDTPILTDKLFDDSTFLLELRRLKELLALYKGVGAAEKSFDDIIYAQTIIQVDGDIMNRFHQYLFDEDVTKDTTKDFLIKTHQDGVNSGQNNWRELMGIVLGFMEKLSGLISKNLKI